MAKNYYIILGVQPDASLDNIKSAYRRRVKQYHPDHFGEDSQPFHDVQEAFAVLSDPQSRRTHDRDLRQRQKFIPPVTGAPWGFASEPLGFRRSAAEPLKPGREPAETVDLGDASLTESFQTFMPSLDEIFDRLWRNFSRLGRSKAPALRRLNVEFVLNPNEASRGGHVRIFVPARASCPTCGGRGGVGYYACWRCGGEGEITGEYPALVSFPAGIPDGYRVALSLERFGIRDIYLAVIFRVSRDEL